MLNIRILDNKISGEELNYFKFEIIINFLSSIIIDILSREYPKGRLKTIGNLTPPPLKFPEGSRVYFIE